MQKINQFVAALLLTGLCSVACEREESTTLTQFSPLTAGAREPCGVTIADQYGNSVPVPCAHVPKTLEVKPPDDCHSCPPDRLTKDDFLRWKEILIDDYRTVNRGLVDPNNTGVLIGWASNVVILQTYDTRNISQEGYHLQNDLIIKPEVARALGLGSNIIPRQTALVNHDPVKGIHNAVLFSR